MRTPTNPAVTTLLNSGAPFVIADCYTITLVNGTQVLLTNAAAPVTVNGRTYATGARITRTAKSQKLGVNVDSMTLDMSAYPTDTIQGFQWYTALRLGILDGASLSLDIAVAASMTAGWLGTFNWFTGFISEIPTVSRTGATLTIKGDSERMIIQMPRRLFQTQCANTLYDSSCGVNRLNFQTSAELLTLADGTGSVYTSNLTNSAQVGYFDQGYVNISSGAYQGMTKTVKATAWNGSCLLFYFFEAFPATLSNQSVYVYPGCDKTYPTCNGKFANILRFAGQDQIPVPETLS